ncbi:MAG TPA: outer membrane protein transport protein [Gammaproteobacteria bacterium]
MNKKITFSLIACCAIAPAVHATNGYQLTGIGAYQKSLGGAVTAKPGSAMTAITNPAGMARIGKRADFSMEMFMPERFVDFTATGGEKMESAADLYGVPALGWTAPTSEGSEMFFGGGMYGTSGLGTDYPLTQFSAAGGGMPAMYFEGYSAIQFWQMAPTLAWNASDKLTYGVSLNIDYQSVAFKQGFIADTNGDGVANMTMTSFDLSRTAQAFGYGISLGVLYDISDDLTVGASYKSKQTFSTLKYQLSNGDIQDSTGQLPMTGCSGNICPAGTYSLNLDFPAMYSVGMAYQLNKFTSLSLDVKQIEWSSTLDRLDVKGPNGELITLAAGWDDQTIIALGIEVAVNYALNVRAGYNKADAPFEESSTDTNYILPAVTQSHFAFGLDYRINRYWQIGMHASKATDETYTGPAPTNAKIGLGITTFGINLGYLF